MGFRIVPSSIGEIAFEDSEVLASNKSITSAYSTYENVGLELDVFVNPGDVIWIGYNGDAAQSSGGTTNTLYLAYKIDSDADVPIVSVTSTVQQRRTMNFLFPIIGMSNGAHTINLRAARDGSTNWTINGDSNAWVSPIFYAFK